MPNWSSTPIRCGKKSLNGIAKLFLGATKSAGSSIVASGLHGIPSVSLVKQVVRRAALT